MLRNQRQAESICDIVTSVTLGQVVADVPRLLVGSEAVRYITQVCQLPRPEVSPSTLHTLQ